MVDFNLNPGAATINSNRDLVVQQIEMLFDTVPSDVLGDLHYGTRYDKYLYELKMSPEELELTILTDLNTLNLCGFRPTVHVDLLNGSERDIILIDINLYKNNMNINKIYRIS